MSGGWYSFEFKLEAVKRAREASSIPGLSVEMGVHYCQVYRWLRIYEEEGEAGLRRLGRGRRQGRAVPPGDPERRVAELERKIGQQAVDLDFLRRAFKRVKESRPNSGSSGSTASTK